MKDLLKTGIATIVIIVLSSISELNAYPGKVISKIKAPGYFPTGLTWDGKYLWVADRQDDKIFQVNPENGFIINAIESPAYWPQGLCFDGTYLWCIDIKGGIPLAENYNAVVYKLDPQTGDILQTLLAPSPNAVGLTWDGQYLWCTDDRTDQIIQFDPEDGTTIKSFRAPDRAATGIGFDGKYLWVADRINDEIYMMDPKSGNVLMVCEVPANYIMGLTYDQKYLWLVDHESKQLIKVVRDDNEKLLTDQSQLMRIHYKHQSTNFGPGLVNNIDVHLAIPKNRPNQEIISIKYSIDPTDIVKDKWGQQTARFNIQNLESGSMKRLEMTVEAKISRMRYFIFPEKVGALEDIPKDIAKSYLVDDAKYQIHHPVIQSAVKEAIKDETNPYWIAHKIYTYLMGKMYYEMQGGWNTAPTVLARGNGSCSEYSFVFISMCRAAGLPARYVGSVVIRNDFSAMDDVFHRWVEVYLPNYGWIPVDPSGGDSDNPRHRALYFGNLNNRFLITTESGGGSETMQWTYNSNQFWQTQAKTNVVFEYFADWEAIQPRDN